MVYWKLFNNDVAPWSGYEGQVVRITNGTAKKQVRWSGSPELRSIESTNYVGLARDSTDPSITRTTLVWLTRAQTHQEHELHWSGSQEPRLIKNINYLGLARKNPDPSRAVCNRLFGFFPTRLIENVHCSGHSFNPFLCGSKR